MNLKGGLNVFSNYILLGKNAFYDMSKIHRGIRKKTFNVIQSQLKLP